MYKRQVITVLWPVMRMDEMSIVGFKLVPLLNVPTAKPSNAPVK